MTKDRLSGRRDLRGALAALLCVVSTSAMASEWIRQLGTAKDDYANAVATDADRNVYVAGSSGLRTGAEDAWLTKLGPGGRVHWKRQLRTCETDRATGVATDADGKVYVAGWTTGSLGGTHQRNRRCMARQIRRCGKHALDQKFNGLPGWYCTAVEVTTTATATSISRGILPKIHPPRLEAGSESTTAGATSLGAN
jgi:Beta-propeller repeat